MTHRHICTHWSTSSSVTQRVDALAVECIVATRSLALKLASVVLPASVHSVLNGAASLIGLSQVSAGTGDFKALLTSAPQTGWF